MISVKYYNNWFKEAGRGHLLAVLSWGGFFVYLCVMFLCLQFDTEYTFFGIGNSIGLIYLCTGMGLLLGVGEFFYLLQAGKQDFYYSLPVKKSTVFWSRYLHGLVHGLLSMSVYMLACGIYQGTIDREFLPYSSGYMMYSQLVYGMIFLLFYHIAVFSVVSCGKITSSVFLVGAMLFYFRILIQNIGLGMAEKLYRTYYRIPLLEHIENMLNPLYLVNSISGNELYQKTEVLEFVPDHRELLAMTLWIFILFGLCAFLQKRRSVEVVGKLFAFSSVERTVEVGLAILAGLGIDRILLGMFGLSGFGKLAELFLLAVAATSAASIVHFLVEYLVQMPNGSIRRRKKQLQITVSVLVVGITCILLYGTAFDSFLPEKTEVKSLSLCVGGVGMGQSDYLKIRDQSDPYLTDSQLETYTLSKDGLETGLEWIYRLRGKESTPLTTVAVCYHMKNSARIYRTYSVSQKELTAFSRVYETEEYKTAAYPIPQNSDVREKRFTWRDGVVSQVIKISGDEKEELVSLYKNDIDKLEMSDLQGQFPIGKIEIKSEKWGRTKDIIVYRSFENTYRFLQEHGIQAGKRLADYPVVSIDIMESTPALQGTVGGVTRHYYEKAEELVTWKGRLVPQEFDLQPLLSPMDYTVSAKANIEEPESESIVAVDCLVMYMQEE